MTVDAYEKDPVISVVLDEINNQYPRVVNVFNTDVATARLTPSYYDTVMMESVFQHFISAKDAYQVMKKGFDSLKPGGYAYLRAVGTHDSAFEWFQGAANSPYSRVEELSKNCFIGTCHCSGEEKVEPMLFFDPLELPLFWEQNGMKLVDVQILPQQDGFNIMYGETYDDGSPPENRKGMIGGFITLIGRKQ